MKLYLPITVDLYNIYPLSIMNVQQYNIGRGALVTLTAAGQVVVPNKESLYVYAKKKDGTIAYATCTLSGNQIKIDYDEQMTAIVGTMTVELQMVDENGNSITTPIFQVNIQPSNVDYKKITSSDEFLALVDALKNVNGFQGQINELNEKLIPLNFNVAKGEDINDSKFCRFGFYSGHGLLNAPTAGWFQWLTFPLNGNIKYPAQLGFWIDNHTNNARMYTRAMSSATGSEVWSSWVEVITKNDVFFVSKTIVLPGGITTRGVFETTSGFIDTKGRTLTGYCMKSARTGLEIHIQTLTVDSSGKCTLVYDKQSEQAFNIEIIFTFM